MSQVLVCQVFGSVHCVCVRDPRGVYRERWGQEQLEDYQRQQHLHCSLQGNRKTRHPELVAVTNRGFYTLSNFSRNKSKNTVIGCETWANIYNWMS